jgi:hypothetical protein
LAERLISLCFGPPTPDRGPAPTMLELVPAWVHLAAVLVLGLAMPASVFAWLTAIAEATG